MTNSIVLPALTIAPRLTVALILGMLIGIERQLRQRHTGVNTHAVVALGAAAFTSLATLLDGAADVRIGGQVVTGIGFLGAGLIMRDGLNVRGLAGAATIWATGAVGTLAGYGFLLEAIEATVLVLLVNLVSPRLSKIVERHAPDMELSERFYIIEIKCEAMDEAPVRSMLLHAIHRHALRLQSLESHPLKEPTKVEVEAVVYTPHEQDSLIELLVGELSLSPIVFATSWTSTTSQE